MRKVLAILMSLWIVPAFSADNAVTLTTGSGVTMRTIDIGAGVQSSVVILGSSAGAAIYGTAGTANANVLTIQGIASGTVVPVSLTSTTITGTVAATQSGTWNIGTVTTVTGVTTVSTVTSLSQFAGAAINLGAGTVGTGTLRITQASDSPEISALGAIADAAWVSGSGSIIAIAKTIANNTAGAIPAGTAIIGKVGIDQTTPGTTNLVQSSVDPCTYSTKINQPISFQTTALTQQIAASGSNKIYICSMSFIASAATVFSVSGGTGSNCASNQLGILGVAGTATHGLSLAANGGLTYGNGAGTVAVTAASSEICLVQSGAGDISGNITYVYAP